MTTTTFGGETMQTISDVREWARDEYGVFHVSMSNLPLTEWHPGVTFCLDRTELFRAVYPPCRPQSGKVCPACVDELRAFGETLPGWMRGVQ